MPRTSTAVIARSKGAPVELVTIAIPDPGPGEVVVRVQACGVCHTDLHYRDGGIGDDFPYLLGHEAAGVVEEVGPGVEQVAPGDYVVLNWRAVCGQCRACLRGRPWYCFNTHNAIQKMTIAEGEDAGTELSPALGIGAFTEYTLVAAGQCTPVDPAAPPQVAGLLGCGVMAGLGAAINTGGVSRGDSVAVIGCGGVGAAAIAGARLAGAGTIIAVDLDERKLATARELGATAVVNARDDDVVTAVQNLTGGHGADVVIDAVGRPETWRQAFYARDLAGTVVLVGVPTPEMTVPDIPLLDVFGRGGALKSSWYGDCLPSRDFPMLIDLYLQERLPLAAFVSETIGIDAVEQAFAKMRDGDVLRSVVILPAGGRADGPVRAASGPGVQHSTTAGTFSLDGQTFEVENNIWVVGDERECVIIDAPHDVSAILDVVGDRTVRAILCTHAHDDHVRVAPELARRTGAPIHLHPADAPLWALTHPDQPADDELADRQRIAVAGLELEVLHTPGHAPGAVCFYVPDLGVVFTGDTLFQGGPGATGRSFSDPDLIVRSIREVLFALPDDTVVHTGHGPSTTIGAEAAALGR